MPFVKMERVTPEEMPQKNSLRIFLRVWTAVRNGTVKIENCFILEASNICILHVKCEWILNFIVLKVSVMRFEVCLFHLFFS